MQHAAAGPGGCMFCHARIGCTRHAGANLGIASYGSLVRRLRRAASGPARECGGARTGAITVTREALPGPPVIIDDINGGHVAEVAPALIDVNDARVADLAPGQTYVGGVSPGPTSVTASGATEPGHYKVKFNAVAGKTYAFHVSPGTDVTHVVALMAGGLAGVSSRPPRKVIRGPLQDHASRAVSAATQRRYAGAKKRRRRPRRVRSDLPDVVRGKEKHENDGGSQ